MFEAFKLKTDQVEQKEEILRSQIKELGEKKRKKFYSLYSDQLKDPDTYAVLNFFFITGMHHFYLTNHLQGSLNLSGLVIGLILIFGGSENGLIAGFSLIFLVIMIELPALFRSQVIVKDYNNRLAIETLLEINDSTLEIQN
tara:strand:+ start:736 stop:1161 length:426 start_codon:yes stop_codon:yes gene_type:complete